MKVEDRIWNISPIETPMFGTPIRYKVSGQKFSSMRSKRRSKMKVTVKKIKVWKYYEWTRDKLEKVT